MTNGILLAGDVRRRVPLSVETQGDRVLVRLQRLLSNGHEDFAVEKYHDDQRKIKRQKRACHDELHVLVEFALLSRCIVFVGRDGNCSIVNGGCHLLTLVVEEQRGKKTDHDGHEPADKDVN